ncbi:extracellular solute-binding protein [Vagococcus sp. PNs007]|uniref:Extracellular solute-binding protein n=1 Tax=Vagococcus proximus TaxID=2991417 RepID=A0ABT5X245_9ENTE|nr:extracellular solute-binding protein [Vagococcus proximus]MDF0480074.1 extracellular solute-binding protein [Vagococcus proximus]
MLTKKTRLMMVGLLVSGVLVGCGSNDKKAKDSKDSGIEVNEKGMPIVKENLKMTMMAPGAGVAEWKDLSMLKDYSKMTNIDFKYTTPPLSDFATKLNLAFASGDLPDIIFGAGGNLSSGMELDYGQQGILVELEDLIPKYAPNLNKLMDEDPSIRKSITTPDGHIYSLPSVVRSSTGIWPRWPLWYNGEWLENLDVKELPKTTEEFYKLLVRFRDEDPNGNGKKDEIPISDEKMDSIRPWLMGAFGMKDQGIEEVDGKVRYAAMTDNYKEFVTYMNRLYKEGLLDSEIYSQSEEQKKGKGQDDRLGVFADWFSYFSTGQTEAEGLKNPMFQPLTSPVSKKAVVPGSPRLVRGTFVITKDNPSPEASLRWADHFYTEEGYELLNRGTEGDLWEYVKNDKGEEVKVYTKNYDVAKAEENRGKVSPSYGINVPGLEPDLEPINVDPNDPGSVEFSNFIAKETEEKIVPNAEVPFPLIYLTKEEQDKVSATSTDIRTYVEQMEAKFITGVEPISNWDKYVETLKSMDMDAFVKIYQDGYDRWAKS